MKKHSDCTYPATLCTTLSFPGEVVVGGRGAVAPEIAGVARGRVHQVVVLSSVVWNAPGCYSQISQYSLYQSLVYLTSIDNSILTFLFCSLDSDITKGAAELVSSSLFAIIMRGWCFCMVFEFYETPPNKKITTKPSFIQTLRLYLPLSSLLFYDAVWLYEWTSFSLQDFSTCHSFQTTFSDKNVVIKV